MPYDIYGETLERGHCEVHPWVHEEYPCSCCYADHQRHEQEQTAIREHERQLEMQHDAMLSQQCIEDDVYGDGVDPGLF
jgi:hypothetical protein